MNLGTVISDAVGSLVDDRLFAAVAPAGTKCPYMTFQRVGGDAINFLDRTIPDRRNYRLQFNVWAESWGEAVTIAEQVEAALRMHPSLQTTIEGSAFDVYEEDTKLHGTRQDFSFWVPA